MDVECTRNIIVTNINSSQVARGLFADKMLRSYRRNPKLIQRTFQTVREVKVDGEETAIIRLNRARFNPIIRAIAFALFFRDFAEKFQFH